MKALALDVATRTGIAVGSAGGAPLAWSEDLGKGKSEDSRFSRVLALTDRLLREHKPDLVAVEAPIGGGSASLLLIGLAACVRGCAATRGVPVVVYQSATVRKHFVGKALSARSFPALSQSAAKKAIKGVVIDRCRVLGWGDLDDDAADAAALWDLALARAGAQVSPAGRLFA